MFFILNFFLKGVCMIPLWHLGFQASLIENRGANALGFYPRFNFPLFSTHIWLLSRIESFLLREEIFVSHD